MDVADYRRSLIKKGRKPATINHALDVLNSFFSWASVKGVVTFHGKKSGKMTTMKHWTGT